MRYRSREKRVIHLLMVYYEGSVINFINYINSECVNIYTYPETSCSSMYIIKIDYTMITLTIAKRD